jgi:hypothetical protein
LSGKLGDKRPGDRFDDRTGDCYGGLDFFGADADAGFFAVFGDAASLSELIYRSYHP